MLLAPVPWQPAQRLVGSPDNVDWHGTWHSAWVLRQAGGDPRQLDRVDWLGYPAGEAFLAPTGMLVDLSAIALLQGLFGAAAGFNLAVWLLLTLLAFAVHRAALALTGPGLAPFVAGSTVLLSQTLATEVANGRLYQLAATALLVPFLAALLRATADEPRRPALAGLALGLGVAAHWHTGQLFVAVAAFSLALAVWRTRGEPRRALIRWMVICVAVAAAIAGPPAIYMLCRLSTIPALEAASLGGAFPGPGFPAEVWQATIDHSVAPSSLLPGGLLRWSMVALAAASLATRRDRITRGWWLLAGMSVVLALGPLLSPAAATVDGREVYRGLPLPYALLVRTVPFLWRLFWVDRCLLFVDLAVGVLAAWTVADLSRRLPGPAAIRVALPLAAVALLVAETGINGALRYESEVGWEHESAERAEAAAWLASLARDPDGGAVRLSSRGTWRPSSVWATSCCSPIPRPSPCRPES